MTHILLRTLPLVLSTFLLLSTLHTTPAAAQSPDRMYRTALNAIDYSDYPKAIRLLRSLLYPKPGKLSDEIKQREAHKHLGLAYYYSKKYNRAKREFLQYLYALPTAELDSVNYRPDLVTFFNDLRKEYKEILDRLQKEQISTKRKKVAIQVVTLRVERNTTYTSPLLCFIPFGVPQLLRGSNLRGSLLLSGQIIALGFNIGAFWRISALQINDENSPQRGRFPQNSVQEARNWQITQFASLGVLSATAVYGLIDCLVTIPRKLESVLPDLPAVDPREFKTSNHTFSLYNTP